ncbi:MAG TPA: hypothetical protein VKQ34_04430 [Candidatus Saccharimonadales bacterium]|nr:hypothetical protein [Candidatus Saccharimonadales bacterium]
MQYEASQKYGSMIRAYERFKHLSINNGSSISLHAARDAADDFFQHCYHLKDWLKKDPATSSLDTENFINKSQPLALAADYCNSSKHGGLDKSSRSGATIEAANVHTTLDLTSQGFIASSRLEITVSGVKYDAFKLATDCIKAWKSFFASNNVSLNDN